MKKLIVVALVFVVAFSVFASAASENSVAAEEFNTIVLKYGTTAGKGSTSVNFMDAFAAKVYEVSGGKVEIEIHPGSTLGNAKQMLELCQMGTIAMTNSSPAQLNTECNLNEIAVLSLPFLYRDYEHYFNVLNGEIGEKYLSYVTEKADGLIGFGFIADGARHFFLTKEVKTLADMKGLKLRVMDQALDNAWCRALGASPTPTATSEIYSSMTNGLVDGAEQPLAAIATQFTDVAKYVILDGHTYNILLPVFSETVWNSLNAKTQKMLKDCFAETVKEQKSVIIADQEASIKAIEAKGCKVSTPSDLSKWSDAMASVYAEFGKGFEKEIEAIKNVK